MNKKYHDIITLKYTLKDKKKEIHEYRLHILYYIDISHT